MIADNKSKTVTALQIPDECKRPNICPNISTITKSSLCLSDIRHIRAQERTDWLGSNLPSILLPFSPC